MSETFAFDQHPDNTVLSKEPDEPDLGGEELVSSDIGLDALMPKVRDVLPITDDPDDPFDPSVR